MPDWFTPSTIAVFLSAVAAVASAIAAWRAPISAAKLAEIMRREAQDAQEARRIKLNVFGAIMQDRAEIYSEDAVRALNLLDVAFINAPDVRACWSELHQALSGNPVSPPHVIDERIRRLLKAMATDLGLADELRPDDFARVYFPTALLDDRNVRQLERKAALARLTASPSADAAEGGTREATMDKWPPKPTA